MLVRTACAAGVLLTGAASAFAGEGVLITQRITMGTGQQTQQIQIEKDRVRAEMSAVGKQVVIFDAAKQLVYVLNVDRKTYSELTKAQADQLGGAVQGMMSQIQASMANLPPEQRAQMEAMMRGRGMGMASAAKPEYKKTGTDHVGKWTCDKYEGTANGQKVSEVCTVDPSALGLSANDVQMLRQFATFFQKLISQGIGMTDMSNPSFSGVPVRTISTSGSVTSEWTDVSKQNFADTLFAIPADFKKEDFPMMGSGGGRGGQ
jgi:hypothetical protein